MSLFALPIVGSAGLGNALFPWARAELFARSSNATVLAPRWARLRIGPWLRREPEKRRYGKFFRGPEHVNGITRLAIRASARRIAEGQAAEVYSDALGSSWPSVVSFEGTGDFFAPLGGEHRFIRDKLWHMTYAPLRPRGVGASEAFVALHVRRGDITRQGFSARELSDVKQYTPLSWFVAMASALRRVDLLRHLPIVVFTDGSADEMEALLALDDVHLNPRQPAITDLWRMSRASLLLASGYSTFGMWASFLGGMPTLYAPGKLQERVQKGRAACVEMEVAAGEPIPEAVCSAVRGAGRHA